MFGRKTAMSEEQRLRWEQTRKRGEAFYCLRSALLVGGGVFIFHSYSDLFVRHFTTDKWLLDSVKPFLVAALGGFFTGFWDWHSTEDLYLRREQHQSLITEVIQDGPDHSQRGTLNGRSY